MQDAQHGEGVAEGGCAGGAEEDGDASAVARVDDLPGGARGAQALGVGGDDRTDEVELFQRDGHRAPGVLGEVQGPQDRADPAFPEPGDVRVDGALAEFEVVPAQVAQGPRQGAVPVGDGVFGEDLAGACEGVAGVGDLLRRALVEGFLQRQFADLGGGVQFVLEVCHEGAPYVWIGVVISSTATVARGGGGHPVDGAFGGTRPVSAGYPQGRTPLTPRYYSSSSSIRAYDGPRTPWVPRATSSAAPSTRTAFCQVSFARSVRDQPRSRSSVRRLG